MKRILLMALVITLMLFSSWAGWRLGYHNKESDLARLALMDNIYSAGHSVVVLQLISEGRDETARQVLTMNANSSLREANMHLSEAAKLDGIATHHLLGMMRRSKDYFESSGQVRPAGHAAKIISA